MVATALTVKTRYNHALAGGFQARARALTREVASARRQAAEVAQQVSLENIHPRRPDDVPARKGRNEPHISSVLRWRPVRGAQGSGVGLNLAELNSKAKHWIIQEIGTGQSAVIRVGGRSNPVGRPSADATYVRTVKAQSGRRIRSTLVWATGPGGNFVAAGAGENQQLFLRKMVKFPEGARGAAYSSAFPGRSQPGIIIRREIEPRHFVQRGGAAGFRVYRTSVLAAARRTLRKGRPS